MSDVNADAANDSATQRPVRVSRLDVRFEAPGVESRRIFANGRMQVQVRVFVEAVDYESGLPVPLAYYPDLVTTRLIQYEDGKPLAREVYTGELLTGWNAASMENSFTHSMPGDAYPIGGGHNKGVPLYFWVSSSKQGAMQIAAEVTVQGKVYRSNGVLNPDGAKINKSVVIVAERVPTYSADQFTWKPQRVEGAFNGATVFRYDLGLYVGGQQINLVEWHTDQYEASSGYPLRFCYTGIILTHPEPMSFTGVVLPLHSVSVEIIDLNIPVKQRVGELVVFQGFPPAYKHTGEQVRLKNFFFSVLDEFGNAHFLSLVTDVEKRMFLLRKG